MSGPLLSLEGLSKSFTVQGHNLTALENVDFQLHRGEVVGLIGESGSGKTTLARIAAGLELPTSGRIAFNGIDISTLTGRARRRVVAGEIQMIFQDTRASLNPRLRIVDAVAEPLRARGVKVRRTAVVELLERVGLGERFADLYPHNLSGGQRQRVVIARAISTKPQLVIADEPVSALDVSVQAQVLNLLKDLSDDLDTAFLFISHDLGVVRFFCDRVSVLYLGRVMEAGEAKGVLEEPSHPYTRALLSASPRVRTSDRRQRIVLQGEVPSPESPPSGCRFNTRCPENLGQVCVEVEPSLLTSPAGGARCHLLDPDVARNVDKPERL